MPNKVLVVDDDRLLTELIKESLVEPGFETEVAHDGNEALEALAGFGADCILLDIFMPVLDGFETLREIRQIDPTVKVVTMSGMFLESGYLAMSEDLGADASIEKPFDLGQLLSQVRAVCGPGVGATP